MQDLEVWILLSEVAEGAVHLEADLKIHFGIVDVPQQSFVTAHVIIIDWLFQKGYWPGSEKMFGFGGLAELMETEPGVEKSGPRVGRHATEFLADAQSEVPPFLSHQMVKPKLKHFGAILEARINGVQFRDRLAAHAQLCVAAGGLQLPFKLHKLVLKQKPRPI